MSKTSFLLIVTIGVLVTAGIGVLLFTRPTEATGSGDLLDSIEEKASIAKSGQETAIRDLTNTIISQMGSEYIPQSVNASIADRFARAEITYRQTGQGAVREYQETVS